MIEIAMLQGNLERLFEHFHTVPTLTASVPPNAIKILCNKSEQSRKESVFRLAPRLAPRLQCCLQ